MYHQIKIGEVAPNLTLPDHLGTIRSLGDLCQNQPLALFLERHLG